MLYMLLLLISVRYQCTSKSYTKGNWSVMFVNNELSCDMQLPISACYFLVTLSSWRLKLTCEDIMHTTEHVVSSELYRGSFQCLSYADRRQQQQLTVEMAAGNSASCSHARDLYPWTWSTRNRAGCLQSGTRVWLAGEDRWPGPSMIHRWGPRVQGSILNTWSLESAGDLHLRLVKTIARLVCRSVRAVKADRARVVHHSVTV